MVAYSYSYHLIAQKILYLMIYFVFKRILSICHIIQRHFQYVPIDLESHFQNYKYFLKYSGLYILTTVNTKNDTRKFCLFVYLRSYNDKSKFSFLETVQSSRNTSYLRTSHFCAKCQYRFLALIFLYTLEKIPWKNYVRFWKWNLKRTPQSA